jgi:acyl carrier protein
MTISSRTPEGLPNRCPVCDNVVRVEPSGPFGDAPCPSCGTLLWFIKHSGSAFYFAGEEADRVRGLIGTLLSSDLESHEQAIQKLKTILDKSLADSLDVVELVMEIESERGDYD